MYSIRGCFKRRKEIENMNSLKELSKCLDECEKCNKAVEGRINGETYKRVRLKYVEVFSKSSSRDKTNI